MVDEIEEIFIDPVHRPGTFYKGSQQDSFGKNNASDILGSTLYRPSTLEADDASFKQIAWWLNIPRTLLILLIIGFISKTFA